MLSVIVYLFVGCGPSSLAPATDPPVPEVVSSTATSPQTSVADTGDVPEDTVTSTAGIEDTSDTSSTNGGAEIYPDGPGEFLSLALTFDGVTGLYEFDTREDWFETFMVTNPDGACVTAEWILGGGVTVNGENVMVSVVLESSSVGSATPPADAELHFVFSSVIVESWDGRGAMYTSGGTWTVLSETKTEMVLSLDGASLCLLEELGVDAWKAEHADCEPTTTGEVVISGYRELQVPDLENGGPAVTLGSGESLCYPIYF